MIRICLIISLELFFLLPSKKGIKSKSSCNRKIIAHTSDSLIQFRFYDNTITIKIKGNPATSPLVFISLHNNENTEQHVVSSYIKEHNIPVIQIENNNHRLVRFTYLKRKYGFDPNRIFSKKGIRLTLKLYGNHSSIAAKKVSEFAALILHQLSNAKTIIAVHNNSNGKYSILSYLKGGKLSRNAIKVHKVSNLDSNDFFLTTSLQFFERLKRKILISFTR